MRTSYPYIKVQKLALILMLFVVFSPINVLQASENKDDLQITLKIMNQPLIEIIEEVAKQIDYDITFDESIAGTLISGNFENTPVDIFFHRVLKSKNVAVNTDAKRKIINISVIGDKKNATVTVNSIASQKDISTIDPLLNKTPKELEDIALKLSLREKKRLSNPSSIDPYTNMSIGEINAVTLAQEKNREIRLNNPDYTLPYAEISVAELENIIKRQEKNNLRKINSPNEIAPMTDKSYSEINHIVKFQEKNRLERIDRMNRSK